MWNNFRITMSSGGPHFISLLRRAAASVESGMDGGRQRLSRVMGTNSPRQISAYLGHDDGARIQIRGRVLANAPYGGPLDDDGWWENLANTYRRWESDEVPDVPVTLRFQEQEQTVITDKEGYYHAGFPTSGQPTAALRWLGVEASTPGREGIITARHEVMVTPATASFGIISDIDDTVLHTGITSLLLAAKLTFLENAKTRKPLDGVAQLYESLQKGFSDGPLNPLFYVSSSPWNLHDLLIDFLRLNEIPVGPVFLRDLGLDRTKFIKGKGHGHKLEKVQELIDTHPSLPFVLIGDSGQEDASIYASIACSRPGRVKAIYIRDVDPDLESERDAGVHRAVGMSSAAGVPMILAMNSDAMAEHACRIGLIPARAEESVSREVRRDERLPETGEQAVKDAVESILPGEEAGRG